VKECNCKHSAELLLDYTDGALDEDQRASMETHLSACPGCRVLLATYKKTTSLCRKALHAAVPQDVEDRLISFLRSRLRARPE